MRGLKSLCLLLDVVVVLLSVLLSVSSAADRTWQGVGPGYYWNTPANWVEGSVSPDDALIFAGSAGLVNTNDFTAATRFAGVKFSSGAGAFVLAGNDIILGGDITNNSASEQVINFGLSLDADRIINAAAGPVTIGGVISGPHGIIKTGSGLLALTNANLYTGTAKISAGTLKVTHTSALGGTGGMVTLNGGALHISTDSIFSQTDVVMENSGVLVLDRTTPGAGLTTTFRDFYTTNTSLVTTLTVTNGGNINSGISTLVFSRNWNQTSSTTIFDIGRGVALLTTAVPSPSLGHTINVVKRGVGSLILAGNYGQWDGGGITLYEGVLELCVIPGDLIQYRAPIAATTGTVLVLRQDANYNFCSSLTLNGGMTTVLERATSGVGVTHMLSNLTFAGSYTMTVNGGSNMASGVAGLTLSGVCTLNGSATFDVSNGISSATVMTITNMAGTGALTKTGSGSLVLTAPVTYSGPTLISGGTLALSAQGSISNSTSWTVGSGAVLDSSAAGVLTVPAGVTLGGSGTVRGEVAVVAGAVLAPGLTGSAGTLTISSNLTVEGGASCNYEYDGIGHTADLVRVTGNLGLPASLNITVSNIGGGMPGLIRLFSYSGMCARTDFQAWTVSPGGYAIHNNSSRGEIIMVREGTVIMVK